MRCGADSVEAFANLHIWLYSGALAVYTKKAKLGTGEDIGSYILYFALLWSTWCCHAVYDVNFAVRDLVNSGEAEARPRNLRAWSLIRVHSLRLHTSVCVRGSRFCQRDFPSRLRAKHEAQARHHYSHVRFAECICGSRSRGADQKQSSRRINDHPRLAAAIAGTLSVHVHPRSESSSSLTVSENHDDRAGAVEHLLVYLIGRIIFVRTIRQHHPHMLLGLRTRHRDCFHSASGSIYFSLAYRSGVVGGEIRRTHADRNRRGHHRDLSTVLYDPIKSELGESSQRVRQYLRGGRIVSYTFRHLFQAAYASLERQYAHTLCLGLSPFPAAVGNPAIHAM